METKQLRDRLNALLRDRESARSVLDQEAASLSSLEAEESAAREAQKILQQVAQQVQNKAHAQVARVVSRCLEAVFEEPYSVAIEFVQRRGKTEAEFAYYKGERRCDPRQTSGGVMQVVALALRLVALCLSRPPRRRLLVLDEPLQGVSAHNLQKMSTLIETLSRDMGVQFVIVTHNRELQVGKVIEL